MTRVSSFLFWLATPFRAMASGLMVLVNLSGRQMRALFSLAMIGGMIATSFQNIFYLSLAKEAVERGEIYLPLFGLIAKQITFNSYLIAWFAGIMGLIVFGADYFRAKHGDSEIGFGKGDGS
jgi:hypothetical protein